MPAGETQTKIAPPLWAALRRGETVLTAAQRPARALRHAFDRRRMDDGEPHWAPANVFALDTWMAAQWSRLLVTGAETRMLLNRTQQHRLWHSIVSADREVLGLRSIDSLADMASDAWAALCLHNGRGRIRELGHSTDTKAFERWAMEFERLCAREGLLPAPHLPRELAAAIEQRLLTLSEAPLHLVDLDDSKPAVSHLFATLQRNGFTLERHRTATSPSVEVRAAQDDASELRAAAEWCRDHVARGFSVAVVVPAIDDRRANMERVFGEILSPESESITASSAAPLFEFSLGRPLLHTASCASALALLRWTLEPLPLANIGALLLSPFVGAAEDEALAAANFDVHDLRQTRMLRPELTLEAFLTLLDRAPLPRLSRRLHAMRRAALGEHLSEANAADQQSHAEWSDAFRNVLHASGWSHATERESLTYQQRQRWESALDELATLDFEGTLTTSQEALAELIRIARQTIFAPESTNAPVQILGPLELGAVAFDALWFLGADDAAWPPQTSSHPLIPWALQRSLGIPGADPASDTEAARALTETIAGSARDVVFSYALRGEDQIRRPSPLLAHWPHVSLPPAPAPTPQQPYQRFADTQPIPPPPDQSIRGGASILQAQAACPFKAFAERRLRATEPEQKDAGHDARERGEIVHKVMERFWAQVQTQPNLQDLPLADRNTILDDCIDAALQQTEDLARSAWEWSYVQVQRERLRNLIQPWLDVEAARPPFEVMHQEEDSRDLTIGPLRLSVRVDRIDATEAGPLILDYKTGNATPSEWLSDRPDQPQLPLYAVLSQEPVGGVAFALLRAGDGLSLKGFAVDTTVLAKPSRMSLPMEEQVADWRRILTTLAEQFHQGDATVAPKCYPKTCQYCTQRILCRLDPTTLDDIADDDAQPAGYGDGSGHA